MLPEIRIPLHAGSRPLRLTASTGFSEAARALEKDVRQWLESRAVAAQKLAAETRAARSRHVELAAAIREQFQARLRQLAELRRSREERATARLRDIARLALEVRTQAAEAAGSRRSVATALDQLQTATQGRGQAWERFMSRVVDVLLTTERGISALARDLAEVEEAACAQQVARAQAVTGEKQSQAGQANQAAERALQMGDLREAEAAARRAWALAPSVEVLANLVLAVVLSGRTTEARELLSEPVAGAFDPGQLQALKALIALQERNFDLAWREAGAGLQVRPDHAGLRCLAATAALGIGRPADALSQLTPAGDAASPARSGQPLTQLAATLLRGTGG